MRKHAIKGFITEEHMNEIEEAFPGFKKWFSRELKKNPGLNDETFLTLQSKYMDHVRNRPLNRIKRRFASLGRRLKTGSLDTSVSKMKKESALISDRVLLNEDGHVVADQAITPIVDSVQEYIQKVAGSPDTALPACLSAHRSGNTKLAEAIYDTFTNVHGYKLPVSDFFELQEKRASSHPPMRDIRLIQSKRMYPVMTKEAARQSMAVISSRWRTMPIEDRVEAATNLRKYAAFLSSRIESSEIPECLAKYAGLVNTPGDEERFRVALGPRSQHSVRRFGFDKYASIPVPTYGNAHAVILKIAAIDHETGVDWLSRRGELADPADVVFCGPPVSEVYGTTKMANAPVITAHGIKIDLSKLVNIDKREVDRVVPGLGDEIYDAEGDLDISAANTVIPSLPMDLVAALKKRFNL